MPNIKVENRPFCSKIGILTRSLSKISKQYLIDNILVCQNQLGGVTIQINATDDTRTLLLSTQGVVDLVKALLLNVSDVTIAVDDDLLKIVEDAKRRSDKDAQDVIDCLRDKK